MQKLTEIKRETGTFSYIWRIQHTPLSNRTNVNHGIPLIIMYDYCFVNYNESTTLIQDIDNCVWGMV